MENVIDAVETMNKWSSEHNVNIMLFYNFGLNVREDFIELLLSIHFQNEETLAKYEDEITKLLWEKILFSFFSHDHSSIKLN